jgi:hypothetical protein
VNVHQLRVLAGGELSAETDAVADRLAETDELAVERLRIDIGQGRLVHVFIGVLQQLLLSEVHDAWHTDLAVGGVHGCTGRLRLTVSRLIGRR